MFLWCLITIVFQLSAWKSRPLLPYSVFGLFRVVKCLFCAITIIIWRAKTFSQMERLFLPDVCQLRSRKHRKFVHAYEREFFSPNFSKFAVKCDWDSKISQNERNLVFLEKQIFFSKKKLEFFSKLLNVIIFFVKCVSNGIVSWKWLFHLNCVVFWLKVRKFSKLEKLENMKKEYFKKNALIFLKSNFTKMGRR